MEFYLILALFYRRSSPRKRVPLIRKVEGSFETLQLLHQSHMASAPPPSDKLRYYLIIPRYKKKRNSAGERCKMNSPEPISWMQTTLHFSAAAA